MKIRTDFVTNSSSSSFCSIHISGSKLNKILIKYKKLFESEDFEGYDITVTDKEFEFMDEECGFYEGPASKDDIASSFTEFIQELADCSEDPEEFEALIEELEENEDEINDSITSLNWQRCDTGWGGDDESRFNCEYDDSVIRSHLGLDEDAEITDEIREQFNDSLADATSQDTTSWIYDGKNFEVTEEHDLL